MSLPPRLLPLAIGVLLATPAVAAPTERLTPERLSAHADRVVRAKVIAQTQETGQGRFDLLTVSTLQVEEVLAGAPASELQLVQLGGERGLERSGVAGDARVEKGEVAVWFLRCRDPQAPTRCTLVGQASGRMRWNPRTQEVQLEEGAGRTRTIGIKALRTTVRKEMAR